MEFPPDNDESQLPPPQPNTSYPPQQPDTSYPLPQPPYPYQPPPPPVPPKKRDPLFWILLAVGSIIVIGVLGALLYTSHLTTASTTLSEPDFKASTTDTTIVALDKSGTASQNANVHFTCTILGFVKDSNGNTSAANVDDPNALGVVVQIAFPDGTDLNQLNAGDTLEVWGIDEGVFSGKNAFGGTVQEVGVTALYMTDQTTGYSTK